MDPTRIDIAFDPTKKIMEGVARHGNTPFCCPIISHVEGNLWQGGCESGLILPRNIKHLISLYPWERYEVNHDLDTEVYIRAYDAEAEDAAPLLENLAALASGCLDRGPTLIHCQAGLNRSSLLAAMVLMRRGRTAREAIDLLREKRSPAVLCNRSFESWLLGREGGRA